MIDTEDSSHESCEENEAIITEEYWEEHGCPMAITLPVEQTQSREDVEVFVGNLRPDVEQNEMVEQLQELFSSVSACISSRDFSVLRKGPKKAKHLFVALQNECDRDRLIENFDGLIDLDFVASDKSLRVSEKKKKPLRTKKTRKRKNPSSGIEDSDDSDAANDPRFKQNKPVADVNQQAFSSPSKETRPSLRLGQILQTEDRNTEYKLGGGIYSKKFLANIIRKYVGAFLNSEGEVSTFSL